MCNHNNLKPLLSDVDVSKEEPSVVAYVDGSYNYNRCIGGCGVYIVDKSKDIVLYEKFVDIKSPSIQIKGNDALCCELNAVLIALNWAQQNGYKSIKIAYDCKAIIHSLEKKTITNDYMFRFREKIQKYVNNLYILFAYAGGDALHQIAHNLSRLYYPA